MGVPFLDLKAPYLANKAEIDAAVQEAMANAAFIGGPNVTGLEQEFAAYCDVAECAAVNSGTDALRFALMAMGLQPGDEVITVPNTFIATSEAVTQAGGKVVFVDVDDQTMQMDPSKIEAAITSRTRVILPVHLTGSCADMDPILAIAARHGLQVLEDACQAHGAKYKGRRAGSMGVAGCFSFYPGKNLGAFGEGGAVVSNDRELIAKIKVIRDHGQQKKYIHQMEGYNGRLDAIQAAVLRIKLRRLDECNAKRRQHAARYHELLKGLPVCVCGIAPECEPIYHLFMIRMKHDRQELLDHLTSRGIGWGLHYPIPLHLQEAYAAMGLGKGSFPVAERLAEEIVSLPMFPELTDGQIGEVTDALHGFFAARSEKRSSSAMAGAQPSAR